MYRTPDSPLKSTANCINHPRANNFIYLTVLVYTLNNNKILTIMSHNDIQRRNYTSGKDLLQLTNFVLYIVYINIIYLVLKLVLFKYLYDCNVQIL